MDIWEELDESENLDPQFPLNFPHQQKYPPLPLSLETSLNDFNQLA